MRLFANILLLVVILSAAAVMIPLKVSAQENAVSVQLFYDQLSPYGSWVEYQNYGYVWIPDVDQRFSPYGTDGHWIFTEDGWTWVSDYSWGWAPFHYGRWAYDDSYGWFWVPHNEWGPAWVTWRRSEGYYGWAPMEPGVSIDVSIGGGTRVPNDRWLFVSDRDLCRPDIDRHYVDRSTNITIINTSTVINNTYTDHYRNTTYVVGPAREDVQRFTGTAIKSVAIRENEKPGQSLGNDQLQIYRPRVQMSTNNDHKAVPSKLLSLKEIKPISERAPGSQQRNENLPANGKEQSSQRQNANPPDKKVTGEPPVAVTPLVKNENIGAVQQPQTAKPSDKKGTGHQNGITKPTGKKTKAPQLRIVNKPKKNKNANKKSNSGNARLLNTKRRSPNTNPSTSKQGRDLQSPKSNEKKQDNPKPPQEQMELQ